MHRDGEICKMTRWGTLSLRKAVWQCLLAYLLRPKQKATGQCQRLSRKEGNHLSTDDRQYKCCRSPWAQLLHLVLHGEAHFMSTQAYPCLAFSLLTTQQGLTTHQKLCEKLQWECFSCVSRARDSHRQQHSNYANYCSCMQ